MNKCVIILDEDLPLGLLANTSAVLAMSIGRKVNNLIGPDIKDASNLVHAGITNTVLPILRTDKEKLSSIYKSAKLFHDLYVVGFCDIAQQSKDYADYTRLLAEIKTVELNYLGIALFGNKKNVNSLSGSLPLLR